MTALIKKLFSICIPVCICSFVLFGITSAMFGRRGGSVTTTQVADVVSGSFDGWEWEALTMTDGVSTWTMRGDYTNIDINVGSGCVELLPAGSGESVTYAEYSGGGLEELECYISGGCLTIDMSGRDMFDFWGELGDAISSGDFSGFMDNRKLTVRVPSNIYEDLYADLGAGSLKINGIGAKCNTFNVGSGAFYYTGSGETAADLLNLNMGSGYAEIRDLPTKEYYIDIGSGSFKIGDLYGSGCFDMGSGSGTLNFSQIKGDNTIEVSSGSLNVEIPQDTNAQFMADIGSGGVKVDACGQKFNLHDDFDGMSFGSGENGLIYLDLGSGSVSITNNDFTSEIAAVVEDKQYPVTTIPDDIPVEEAVDGAMDEVDKAVDGAMDEVDKALDNAMNAVVSAIEGSAPKAPEAPEAPEAPNRRARHE